jgi:hypothetical protein
MIAETFELPNPTSSSIPLNGGPEGMAIDEKDHQLFIANGANHDAAEYWYPSGVRTGTVSGNSVVGFTVDR